MKRTTLLIMAAGIGSRFGTGIKQLAKVDKHDHIIMDYSIHDAIEAGFNKVVFIIRKDIEEDFKEVIGNRIEAICTERGVEVGYCFQDLLDIPGEFPEGRTKPWGTGQAIISAKNMVDGAFAVINADDYYGKEAYVIMHDWLVCEHESNAYAMSGFILKNTLSDNGGVTRGVCQVESGHSHVTSVVETRNIIKTPDGAEANGVKLDPECYVSMNFWGFPDASFIDVLEEGFKTFFEEEVPANPLKSEYLLPTIIGGMLDKKQCSVKVLETRDKWFGVTYAEDKEYVMESIRALITEGLYSEELYD